MVKEEGLTDCTSEMVCGKCRKYNHNVNDCTSDSKFKKQRPIDYCIRWEKR